MKRVGLFIFTNIAVLVVLSIVLRLLGVDSILDERGVGLDVGNLLVLCAVFGMGGSGRRFGRLFMSHPPLDERIAALKAAG